MVGDTELNVGPDPKVCHVDGIPVSVLTEGALKTGTNQALACQSRRPVKDNDAAPAHILVSCVVPGNLLWIDLRSSP